MPKLQKRDSRYYLRRLEAEFPAIHDDYLAGRYPSVRAACVAAGIRKSAPAAFGALKSAWARASSAERAKFLNMVSPKKPLVAAGPASDTFADGHLTPYGLETINEIMNRRALTAGKLMKELGFSPSDQSLSMAMHRGTRVRNEVVVAVQEWLKRHAT
jgi:hypothetical protein